MLKKIGLYSFACLTILSAILIILSGLLTPSLERHRADIEMQVSNLLEMPVKVKAVHISWYQYQPDISLNGVTVFDKSSNEPVLQIKQVHVLIAIPTSLWQRKPIFNGIVISGSSIHIDEKSNGDIVIRGFPIIGGFNEKPYERETKFTDMLRSLLKLPQLMLNDVDLSYIGKTGIRRFVSLYHLKFQNQGNHHQILGKAILRQALRTMVTVQVKWVGDEVDLNQMKADIYLSTTNLALAEWWKGHTWHGWSLDQGKADATIWTVWNRGQFERVQCQFDLYGLELTSLSDHAVHSVDRIRGDFDFKRDGEKQIFAGEHIAVEFPTHAWPETHFYLTLQRDVTGKLSSLAFQSGYINLLDVQKILFSSQSLLSDADRKLLSDLQLTGDIQDVDVLANDSPLDFSHLSLKSHFTDLGIASWHHLPSMQHLTGLLQWDGQKGVLSLTPHHAVLQYNEVFERPIVLDQLSGKLFWQQIADKSWVIHLQNLMASNQDITLKTEGALMVPLASRSVVADLKASFSVQNASHITHYLPLRLFNPNLNTWLKQAFKAGTLSEGSLILNGPLNDFPFDKRKGAFKISGYANRVDMRFAPAWPMLTELDGRITFAGYRMAVDVDRAKILDIPIMHVTGVIPDLNSATASVLSIHADPVTTDFAEAFRLIHNSPLEQSFGKRLTDLAITGPLRLTLALTVPLDDPEKTAVQGNITFQDSQLALTPWHLTMDQLHGALSFTESSIKANDIQGVLFNKPAHLQLSTSGQSRTFGLLRAMIVGSLEMTDLESWLKVPLSSVVTGKTDFNLEMDVSSTAPTAVRLQSNLVGTVVHLPGSYAKAKTISRPFSASIVLHDRLQPLRIDMQYADLLNLAFTLQSLKNPLQGALGVVLSNNEGTANIQLIPKANGFTIQSLTVTASHFELHATGDAVDNKTHLTGGAISSNVSDALNGHGFNAHNFIATKGDSTFDVTWRTPPTMPTLTSLSGQLAIHLGAGRITELSGSTNAKMDLGRMLSLFSLQTIPRRLTLDFSDVFQKGYSFDVVKGEFKLTNGDAYTRNTYFDGPVARVDIAGRIGLAKQDYDLTLNVTPHVTSSIPVAATLLTGQPVIGIAAWALDKVISPSVGKVTGHYYAVTGTWDNPTWKKIATPSH